MYSVKLNKMKILFVSHYSFLYGSNRSLDSLIDYFHGKGDDVEVLLPTKGKFYEHLRNKDIMVHTLRFFYEVMYVKWNKKYLSLPILWIYNLMMFPLLLWKVKKIAPDVVYSNSSVDAYSIFIAKILGCKHVYHVREFLKEDSDYQVSEIRSMIAMLGLEQNVITRKMKTLSGGEIVKILLCKMLLGRYNVLIMDEPNNYLDIPSCITR